MQPSRREHLAGNIIVWIAHLSQSSDSLDALAPCLDSRDRERAARFHFPEDKARFSLGRGMLRQCLGQYLNQAPETIELAYTDRGRPVLPHDEKLQFSISHTQDLVALAVTEGAQVGIDLETVQPQVDLFDLAERIFSAEDLAAFQSLPSSTRLAAFYRAWIRKEAYLKARGEGITYGLQEIAVSMGEEGTPTLRDRRHQSVTESWLLRSLPVPAGYAGALACNDPKRSVEGIYIAFPAGKPSPVPLSSFN